LHSEQVAQRWIEGWEKLLGQAKEFASAKAWRLLMAGRWQVG
jgi:hypothetical protein